MSIRKYYEIVKPGIIYGNAITVIAGFLLASRGDFRVWLFITTLIGISLVIASGCVFNNYIDRDVDAKMGRTKERALVTGEVSGRAAIVYGTVLGLVGFFILAYYVNLMAMAIAALGFFFYVFMYSLWWKRRSSLGTFIGSISGAVPPVVGYAAASGKIDIAAVILFAIMVIWQMPHFFAIAIRRQSDYAAAGVPVMSVAHGVRSTKVQMLLYIITFIIVAPLLTFFGYTGYAYLAIALLFGLIWLGFCIKGLMIPDSDDRNIAWARGMFTLSIVVMMVLFVTIAVGALV